MTVWRLVGGDGTVSTSDTCASVDSEGCRLFGIRVFGGRLADLYCAIENLLESGKPELIVTANVDHAVRLERDPGFREAYEKASVITLDGAPLVALFRLLGRREAVRIAGADLLPDIVEHSVETAWRVLIVGGAPGVSEAAVCRLRMLYPKAVLESVHFPDLLDVGDERSLSVIKNMVEFDPDVVFLCLGSPKQEMWFSHWVDLLPACVYVGAGAAVEFAAGRSRAPKAVQRLGLEWVWRLCQDPKRLFRRYVVVDSRFLALAVVSLTRAMRARNHACHVGSSDIRWG